MDVPLRRRIDLRGWLVAGLAFLSLSTAICTAAESPAPVTSTGTASNDRFVVLATPPDAAAWGLEIIQRQVTSLQAAWPHEPPPWSNRAVIYLTIDRELDRSSARTVFDGRQGRHVSWVTAPDCRRAAHLLEHECGHLVLGHLELPRLLEEGICVRSDDRRRRAARQARMAEIAQQRAWPSLARLLAAKSVEPNDLTGYAVGESLVDFLIGRGSAVEGQIEAASMRRIGSVDIAPLNPNPSRIGGEGREAVAGERENAAAAERLLCFGRAIDSHGVDEALRRYYGLSSSGELQLAWQRWVTLGVQRFAEARPTSPGGRR